MRHQYDCEIYQLADLLKDMLLYEEEIDRGSDLGKHLGLWIDNLIDSIRDVNRNIEDLTQEAQEAVFRCETIEDELQYANDDIDDLRDSHRRLINQMDESIRQLKEIYE